MVEESSNFVRSKTFKAKLLRYPRYLALHEKIQQCLQMTHLIGEPHCMSLEGPTGAGKTMLLHDYIDQFNHGNAQHRTQVKILYVPTPDNPTIHSMVSQTLEVLKDPAAFSTRRMWQAKSRLKHFIIESNIEMIVFDDFQHLTRSDYVTIENTAEWLKALIKETGVCCVVAGIEGDIEAVLDANEQLSRLFAARERLGPFQWDPLDQGIIEEFAQLIHQTESMLQKPLECGSEHRAELLGRICYATKGLMANVMNLLRLADSMAQTSGRDSIDLVCLSRAFQTRLAGHFKTVANPFEVPLSTLFVPPNLRVDPVNPTSERTPRSR